MDVDSILSDFERLKAACLEMESKKILIGIVGGADSEVVKAEDAARSIHVDFAHTVKVRANAIDTYQMDLKLFGVLPYKNVDIQVIQDKMLIPSGIPIGIYVKTNGVLVVGVGEFENSSGETVSPAKYALQKGDYILECNGEAVENKKQFISISVGKMK